MHDTAKRGRVTSSASAIAAEDASGKEADDRRDGHPRQDLAGREVSPAALERGGLRRGVVRDRRDADDERPEASSNERHEGAPAHRATLRSLAGDVDRNGDVVDRLRPALCELATVDLDEHLLAVVRMVAASRELAC